MKSLQLPKELSIEERGLRFRDRNDDSLMPWDHIRKWRETSAYFLIYLTDLHFVVLPKRAFSDNVGIDQLRSLLSKQIPSV